MFICLHIKQNNFRSESLVVIRKISQSLLFRMTQTSCENKNGSEDFQKKPEVNFTNILRAVFFTKVFHTTVLYLHYRCKNLGAKVAGCW